MTLNSEGKVDPLWSDADTLKFVITAENLGLLNVF
jgi:hypothetical protein